VLPPAVAQRRLKLANVSPKLHTLYRKGELEFEDMMAFAIVDDHAAQEDAWTNLRHHSNPSANRAYLTREAVSPTDKLAKFVGVEAYVEAGGAVLRDLFEDEDKGYLTDRPLLLRLAAEKLDAAMETHRAEGWKWVSAELEPDHSTRYEYLDPLPNEAEDNATEQYAPEDMARAGVLLRVGYDGSLAARRGLVHPNDMEPEPGSHQSNGRKSKGAPGEFPPVSSRI